MKKRLKLILFVTFSLVYFYVNSYYTSISFFANFENASSAKYHSQEFCSLDFEGLLCHTDKTEGYISFTSESSPPSVNNPFKKIAFLSGPLESIYRVLVSSYCCFWESLGLRGLHTCLIFPFHYFW